MDLIAKVNSYEKLDDYIKMGANAFLFGIKDFSINSLTKLKIKDLKKIKIKYKNIKIYILIDKNMFNKDLEKLTKFLINVDKLNLEGIFFYDLAVYYIKEKYNLNTPLVWNQNYFVNNYETCNYYYTKGIKYGVISNEITKEEIEKIVKNTKMNMFINTFGYQMMSYSKRKLVSNYFKFFKKTRALPVGAPCVPKKLFILPNACGLIRSAAPAQQCLRPPLRLPACSGRPFLRKPCGFSPPSPDCRRPSLPARPCLCRS